MSSHKARIMLYSHDTYGLGHLRRSLAIAGQVAADLPKASQLLITGSMVAGAFGLPPRLDMIKLPALSKRSSGKYQSRALPLTLNETMAWRTQMIHQAVTAFKPDLVLVDKSPAGVQGEMLPALRYLKTWSPETKLVLGMRDIEDDAGATRAEWEASGVPQLHDEVYDHILLYGERNIFDPVEVYGMSASAEAKLIECGYLGRADAKRSPEVVRRELGIGDNPFVVVTVGGGGDGYEIIQAYLEMLGNWPGGAPFHSLIVTGPLMPHSKRKLLRQSARANHLTIVEFTPDLGSYLAAADLVISMAGYNTVCEVLTLGARSLLVPRTRPRTEQLLRAERLAARGLARMLMPEQLSPERLAAEIESALAEPRPARMLDMNGLSRVGRAITDLVAPPSLPSHTRQTVNAEAFFERVAA
ncbi:MAG: glycosyltransferase [Chloroflexi bacterium]|nr:glycosyltransferase [Chloroflexota bacterium]